jgi:hypothetical protein
VATEKTASVGIKLDSDVAGKASEDAVELEKLRRAIHGSQDAVKQLGAAMRSLRGDSDEVKKAKSELKKKITEERDAISRNNLALLKQGLTYERLAERQRKAEKEREKLSAGIRRAGGPIHELTANFESLKSVVTGTGGRLGALGLVGGTLVAVFAGMAAAVVAGAVALARFVVEGANAARAMNLVREAASGSAENAANLGTQVDALAAKVPTAKTELNALAAQLTRTLSGTYASGQGIVDTFNLVAQASSAMGDEVGRQLGDIITRGKQFGRIQINPFELQGTGVSFENVAGELAKQMGVGIAQARAALFEGRVKLDDGAKALRAAVERRFAGINARKLLDLNTIVEKLHERFQALTKGVNIEPFLEGLDRLSKLFDSSTVAGEALQTIVSDFGNAFVQSFARDGVPTMEKFVKSLVIMALRADIEFLRMKKGVLDFIGKFGGLLTVRNVVIGFTALVGGLTAAFAALAISTIEFWGPIVAVGAAVAGLIAIVPTMIGWWNRLNDSAREWGEGMRALAGQLVDGFVNGLSSAWHRLTGAISSIGEGIKTRFKQILGIASPSKVFALYGAQTAEGFAGGLEGGASRAQGAAEVLAPSAPSGGGGGAGARVAMENNFVFQISVGGGGSGPEIQQALSDPSFLAKLTHAVELALQSMGVPTAEPST